MASLHGIEEPVVVGVTEGTSTPDEPSAGATVGDATWEGAKAGGSIVPVFGHVVGAVIGAIVGAFKALGNAARTTPDDARRYLYEIGYRPGKELKTARVTQNVTPSHLQDLRRARYIQISDEENYGLDKVNFWLERAGETTGQQADNPMPLGTYFDNLADAYVWLEFEQLLSGKGHVEVPMVKAPLLVKSVDPANLSAALPLHAAILRYLRQRPEAVQQLVDVLKDPLKYAPPQSPEIALVMRSWNAGAPAAFKVWVDSIQSRVGDRGENPVNKALTATPSDNWVFYGGLAAVGLGLGATALVVSGAVSGGKKMARDDLMSEALVPKGAGVPVAYAVGGVVLAGAVAWLLFGGASDSPEVKLAPTERVKGGFVGQEVIQDGRHYMVGLNGELVPVVGTIEATRVANNFAGRPVMVNGTPMTIQADGSLKPLLK